jgi:hypothetical protein
MEATNLGYLNHLTTRSRLQGPWLRTVHLKRNLQSQYLKMQRLVLKEIGKPDKPAVQKRWVASLVTSPVELVIDAAGVAYIKSIGEREAVKLKTDGKNKSRLQQVRKFGR